MMDLEIRPIATEDRTAWDPLWAGYLAFYETGLSAEMTDLTWTRLIEDKELHGFIAMNGRGEAVGLVHYLFHPSTWSPRGYCYLEDLFVVPATRGLRVGRRLIAAVTEAARAEGATRVYWHTEEFNGQARRLYERVAKRTPFLRYQIVL